MRNRASKSPTEESGRHTEERRDKMYRVQKCGQHGVTFCCQLGVRGAKRDCNHGYIVFASGLEGSEGMLDEL